MNGTQGTGRFVYIVTVNPATDMLWMDEVLGKDYHAAVPLQGLQCGTTSTLTI